MRALVYRMVLLLALLFVSAAGQRVSAPSQRQGVSPLQPSQQQAVIARGSLQTLALSALNRPTRRGYDPPAAAGLAPALVKLSVLSPHPIEFQRTADAPPTAISRSVHGPRAPPARSVFA